jgi:predicted lipoprotein with Yx(FWY)xxD motif
MKKYKTWEIIKMLTTYPMLKFTATAMNGLQKVMYYRHDLGFLCQQDGDNIKFYDSDEWTLIQQPIPFLEAVQAYAEGKTIRVECEDGNRQYKPLGMGGYMMMDDRHQALTSLEILKGKWYICEEK